MELNQLGIQTFNVCIGMWRGGRLLIPLVQFCQPTEELAVGSIKNISSKPAVVAELVRASIS